MIMKTKSVLIYIFVCIGMGIVSFFREDLGALGLLLTYIFGCVVGYLFYNKQ